MTNYPSESDLRDIYGDTKTIAVVGASADPEKDANSVPAYLQGQGYAIIPVNPRGGEILGQKVYASLMDVDGPIDVVDVFRPAAETPDIARQAVAKGAKVLWLQRGIESEEARQIAEEGGLKVVMDMCMRMEHQDLGLTT